MSALTTVFNYLYVYLVALANFIFGGYFELKSFSGERLEVAQEFMAAIGCADYGQIQFPPRPILMLIVGIFAVGSIIGLVRRLVR